MSPVYLHAKYTGDNLQFWSFVFETEHQAMPRRPHLKDTATR